MGSSQDPRAVVDPQCKVIGVSGLRVIDASIGGASGWVVGLWQHPELPSRLQSG
jgi:hypothetical protein